MLKEAQKLWNSRRTSVPAEGFLFDRPLVLLQSDDWGRVGVRDQEGFEQIRSSGIRLGEKPYDFYSLETADDVTALSDLLMRHRDSTGRPACLEMNFVLANVDFPRSAVEDWRTIQLMSLSEGLPGQWKRPGLFEAYAKGITDGAFAPALHGLTHFCTPSVEHSFLSEAGERGHLLRTLWQAETPYIYWRMPWVGYEYWAPESPAAQRFLSVERQQELIAEAVGIFVRLFGVPPRSACAPGYRANEGTACAWARHGIRIAQNGPGKVTPPYFDHSRILQLSRTMDFEPAVDPMFSLDRSLRMADGCIARRLPVVVSVHSINFHSTLKDFRSHTLRQLDQFLSALEARYPDLLYVNDADVWDIVQSGTYGHAGGTTTVRATKQGNKRNWLATGQSA